jgi:hypothetical protein
MPRRRRRNPVEYPNDPATTERVAAVADAIDRRYRLAERADPWRGQAVDVADVERGATVLALDDYSRIPFVRTVVGVTWYQYRARLRCGTGDLYAVTGPEIEGYEDYCRGHLGLGDARTLRIECARPGELALARCLLSEPESFGQLVRVARDAGGLLVHPYMAIESVWELARELSDAAGVPVRVLGPLPHITRLANDKARFSEMVEALLGNDALASTAIGENPEAIAEHLSDQVHRAEAVALKMPSCASGLGNRIFRSAPLRGKSAGEFRALVDRFLEDKEWDGEEPVLVVEWHRDVLESPSTQCWIPPAGAGDPEVEEVFEQSLLGEEGVFEGAMLSGLPRRIRHDFMVKSWLLCCVLQRLGYVGRCSFDALVVGRTLAEGTVKLVECNARWGGTSTPMNLMKRVFGDFRDVPYKAQDYVDERLVGMEFGDLLELLGDHLYDARTGRGRVLLYNVGGVTQHGKFDVVVTGRSFADIGRFIREGIPGLIERYVRDRGD